MKVYCPLCCDQLPAANINVATDVAACPQCDEVFPLSSLVSAAPVVESFPPRGDWFEDHGTSWILGATTRSPVAFFLYPFAFVWSTSTLGGMFGAMLQNEVRPLMLLFSLPFVLGGVVLWAFASMMMAGRPLVIVDGNEGRTFLVGPIGWTRTFDWKGVDRIEECGTSHHGRGNISYAVALEGRTRLVFGSTMSSERRYYMLNALRTLLTRRYR